MGGTKNWGLAVGLGNDKNNILDTKRSNSKNRIGCGYVFNQWDLSVGARSHWGVKGTTKVGSRQKGAYR